jgi:hypothetical protein
MPAAPDTLSVDSSISVTGSKAVGASAARRCVAGRERRLGDRRVSYAGFVVSARARAVRRPGGSLIETFGRVNVNGYPTVFGVLAEVVDRHCRATHYRVQLPVRPNGTIGYVRARSLSIYPVRARLEVDLSERRIHVFRDGRHVRSVITAVGSESTPTPTGRYYVNQRLRAGDPTGPYGFGGIGISAFSPVLVYWPQGGPIAIHGTNAPDSIGRAASNGCLRVDDGALRWLFQVALAGTPVHIRV